MIEGYRKNIYIDNIRYLKSDTWITKKEWVKYAQVFINKDIHIVKALEILLSEEFEKYYEYANNFIQDWNKTKDYDYTKEYYNILAFFPKKHPLRIFLNNYNYGTRNNYNSTILRKALIHSGDIDFCKFLANKCNKIIRRNCNNNKNLEAIINIVSELGTYALKYIKAENLVILKKFVYNYLDKDKQIAYKILNDYPITDKRILWISDNIALIAWSLQWYDILDYLIDEDWYWLFLFEDSGYGYYDDKNINLLVWSDYTNNYILRTQAIKIIEESDVENKIDGVIALSRLDNQINVGDKGSNEHNRKLINSPKVTNITLK